ncbi:MAG: type III PLP-dependent enzyme [Geminicoccaceae bacterium]
MVQTYGSAGALLSLRSPVEPVLCVRPHVLAATAERIVGAFPGDVLYAVKCNDTPVVLEALWQGGVRHFDTASIGEVRTVKAVLPDAACHFMHPVKAPEAIAEAYHVHGVRRFVLDHADELAKIVAATGAAPDLELYVRLAVPGEGAVLSLAGKFGIEPAEAPALLQAVRKVAARIGLTFHVGSQCVEPVAFERAVALAAAVARQAGGIDDLDVGGGFPAHYCGSEPAFAVFARAIAAAVRRQGLACRLQCEPGRALVADGASALARVELRRGQRLFLNDGIFGNLAELKWIGPHFPIRVVRDRQPAVVGLEPFELLGPTCDSVDALPGPWWLPGDVATGEWLEVGMTGAYSNAFRTRFNGFGSDAVAIVSDRPWYVGRTNAAPPERLAA